MKLLPFQAAVALSVLIAGSAQANLLVNGGFEEPVVPTGTILWIVGPQTIGAAVPNAASMPGWTINTQVDVINTYWLPAEGNQSLDLVGRYTTGSGNEWIQQSFATTPGTDYLLSFMYANNADVGSASAKVSVFGAATLLDTTISHSGSAKTAMNYTAFSQVFTADSTTTILRFTHLWGGQANGIALDAVSVVALGSVPDTGATALLLAMACAVLPLARRRR